MGRAVKRWGEGRDGEGVLIVAWVVRLGLVVVVVLCVVVVALDTVLLLVVVSISQR